MNKILILFLSFGLYACAPENDPTSKYDANKYVPLKEKNIVEQKYLPNDAIKLSVESQPQWEIGKINKIKVILNIKLVELVDPVIKVKVGKNSEIPKWMTFSLDSQKNSQYEYILSGNPENRVNEENNVSEYEIEFLLSYNKEKTSARTIELLKFYQSQNSHLVSIGIKKNRSEK